MSTTVRRVAILANKGHPMMSVTPKVPGVDFIVGQASELKEAKLDDIEMLIAFCSNRSWAEQLIELWPAVPNVKWVHSFSAGIDAMAPFIKECLLQGRGLDVSLTNGRGAFSDSLGEWVMTSVLYFNKQVPRCINNRKEKKWDRFVMNVVDKKTIGFVGFGHIAKVSARLAKHFNMRVLAMRRDVAKDDEGLADAVFATTQQEEMFGQCDFVVSVLPGTPDTQNFFDKKAFSYMKPGSHFISIGRGVVVDEDALYGALQGHLGGAALDVFKTEPLPEDSKLWDCDNLLLSAHNADLTEDYYQLGWGIWQKNYEAFVQDKEWHTPVDKTAGY